KLGRTFRHFGHNAPSERVFPTGATVSIDYQRKFTGIFFGGWAAAFPGFAGNEMPLEPEATELPLGSRLAIQLVGARGLPEVEVSTVASAMFALEIPAEPPALEVAGAIARRPFDPSILVGTGVFPTLLVARISDLRNVTCRFNSLFGPATIATLDAFDVP